MACKLAVAVHGVQRCQRNNNVKILSPTKIAIIQVFLALRSIEDRVFTISAVSRKKINGCS